MQGNLKPALLVFHRMGNPTLFGASPVLAIAAMGALSGCGEWPDRLGETRHENHSIALDKSDLVRVNMRMGVGELMVASGTAKLMEGEYSYDFASGEPVIDYRPG